MGMGPSIAESEEEDDQPGEEINRGESIATSNHSVTWNLEQAIPIKNKKDKISSVSFTSTSSSSCTLTCPNKSKLLCQSKENDKLKSKILSLNQEILSLRQEISLMKAGEKVEGRSNDSFIKSASRIFSETKSPLFSETEASSPSQSRKINKSSPIPKNVIITTGTNPWDVPFHVTLKENCMLLTITCCFWALFIAFMTGNVQNTKTFRKIG
eukprot:UN23399